MYGIGIKEDELMAMGGGILDTLLIDRTTGENIIWATDDYAILGDSYTFFKHITLELITGEKKNVIQPRVAKNEEYRRKRARKMAEVFHAVLGVQRYNNNTTMTKYSEFIKQGNEVCYNGRKVVIDEILDYTFEEIPTADELNKTPNLYFVDIIYDDMTKETVPVCKLKSLCKVADLTESELIELWKQIHVGSLSYKDYSITMGVERKYLSDVCDSYLEAIDNNNSYGWLTKDTPMNFAEYCLDYCVLT